MIIKPGHYKHYKGADYFVWGEAKHSETCETMLMYRCLYGDCGWWVRPEKMFTQTVVVEGVEQLRFTYQGAMSFTAAESVAQSIMQEG